MGCSLCKKPKANNNIPKNLNNTTQNIIIRNQPQPYLYQNQSSNYLNNNNFQNYTSNTYINNPYNNYKNPFIFPNNNKNNFPPFNTSSNYNNLNTNQKPIYSYEYYKNNYANHIIQGQFGIETPSHTQQNFNNNNYDINQVASQIKESFAELNSELIELEKRFKNIKKKNKLYYKDIKSQYECISNYKFFINELNHQLNSFHDQLNISLFGQKLEENILNQQEKAKMMNELQNLSYKIKQLNSILEAQNRELKNIEIDYKLIQEKFNEIKENANNNENNQKIMLMINNESISYNLNDLEEASKNLENNRRLYEQKKKEIEQDINSLQDRTEKKISEIQLKRKNTFKKMNIKQNQNDKMNDPLFLKGSMLFGIKDFSKANDIFNSIYLFNQQEEENYYKQDLLKKNWNEVCYVYDDYDIYDINYELKAVGLPENTYFTSCSFGFKLETDIEILAFEINGVKTNYNFEKYSLYFAIKMKNLDMIKIHIKYKEAPLESELTEGEIKIKRINKAKYYGLSKRLAGKIAKFTLKNVSNMEVINFEDEFFIKTNENEYTWGGRVPEGGKTTVVRFSKKEARYRFYEKNTIKSVNNLPINNTTLKIPICYKWGNNHLVKFNCSSKQTKRIKIEEEEKLIAAQFLNTETNKGEFIIEGEIINRCKGDWVCNLTDEEIESLIPDDFRFNKNMFKQIALGIIREYDEEHKNSMIKIPDVAKIGKWIKKNVKYDINYSGRNDITATDTYNNLEGVCDHFTKLYNALMYSLGYKVVYVIGYALDKNDSYSKEDAHAWSLIKIDGKWLPFDATWGIFSGKFPVSHVFKQYDCKGIITHGYDCVSIGKIIIKGNFLG